MNRKNGKNSSHLDVENMDSKQLEQATKQFDEEFVIDTTRPLTPAEERKWQKAKTKRGRPRLGDGVKVISVSVELRLLAKVDAYAKRNKVTRANLISRGLRAVLEESDED